MYLGVYNSNVFVMIALVACQFFSFISDYDDINSLAILQLFMRQLNIPSNIKRIYSNRQLPVHVTCYMFITLALSHFI